MNYSLYQEFYKLTRKKVTWVAPLIMIILMLLIGLTYSTSHIDNELLIVLNFNSNQWINLVLILVGSNIFTMEYQNNAILTLLYKSPSRIYVYFSKFIVIFMYDVALHVLAWIVTISFNFVLPNFEFNLLDTYQYSQNLFMNLTLTNLVDLFTTLFVISLIFMISCLINENAVVIAICLGVVFMGQGTSNQILNFYHHFINVVKWNPINMLNLTYQYANHGMYMQLTKLSNVQMIIATTFYISLFFFAGYSIFKKKRY